MSTKAMLNDVDGKRSCKRAQEISSSETCTIKLF